MTTPRPFRFGIALGAAATGAEWRDRARRAEDAGFSVLLLADHYVNPFPPLTPLMAAAAATTTLRVGSLVFDNDFRHPALLAKEAAALDLLSDGRFELGIGGGWLRDEYDQAGIPFDPPDVRIARLAEGVRVIKDFFTQETVNFAGTYYTITDLPATPKPVQRPHPPIFIGGGGPRLLQLAAREADIIGIHTKVNANGTTDFAQRTQAGMAEKLAIIREAAGERFDQIELNILVRGGVTDQPLQAAAAYAEMRGWRDVSPEQALDTLNVLYGSPDQITAKLLEWRERFGISYIVIADEANIAPFAPVVRELTGK